MISSFISLYYFSRWFIETDLSWLIFESITDLKINTSILFILDFAKYIILSSFFSVIFYLYFLIPIVVAEIFNPIAELVIPIGIPTKETKEEMQTHPVIVKAKRRSY